MCRPPALLPRAVLRAAVAVAEEKGEEEREKGDWCRSLLVSSTARQVLAARAVHGRWCRRGWF